MNGGSSNNSSGKSTNLPLIEFSHASSDSAAANGDNGGIVEQSNARSPNGIFANNFLGPEEAANMKDLALSSDNAENDSDSADEEDELFSRKTTGSGGGSGSRIEASDGAPASSNIVQRFSQQRHVFLGKCAVVVSIAAVIFVTLFFLIQAVFKKSAAGSGAKSRHVSVTTLASHAACSHITVEDVWIRGYPKMGIEGPLRLLDVNSDGILDIIVPFAS
uniref:VCBS repeat-containing protein n=1 Tax=Macrostomum lignano TaxID=282301 RepID=A0A1I8IM12_9PLAT